jgi:rare lipoprotein A (peptidoglycan hydrolase)
MTTGRCNAVMKPHTSRPAARPFSFGAGAGLLLLVSACSTFSLPSDRSSGAGSEEATVAVAPEEPEPEPPAVKARRSGSLPATRSPARRVPPASGAAMPADPFAGAAIEPPDPGLQTLTDGAADDAGAVTPPVAGPVPKLEPLAAHANRPYRLRGRKYRPMTDLQPFRQRGVASWYGKAFHGRRTATGERYNMHAMTAAHPTLPLPSYVRVTNLNNGTSVIVRVNDRGPFAHNRVIDLSHAAAQHLDIMKGGLAAVEINLIVPEPAGPDTPAPVAGIGD